MNSSAANTTKVEYSKNGFPMYTLPNGICLTFQESEHEVDNGRSEAESTRKDIARVYPYLNPNRWNGKSYMGEDWHSIKYNINRGNHTAYKSFLESKSKTELEKIKSDVEVLYNGINDFQHTTAYKNYIETHSCSGGGPGGSGYVPEYKSFGGKIASFLGVIRFYITQYDATMKHVAILHHAGHDVSQILSTSIS